MPQHSQLITKELSAFFSPLPVERPPLRAAVFDFDGTISTLRHGWETIMLPLMVEMIAGPAEQTAGMREEVDAYIDASTGIQTIQQMMWLAEAVARWGLNPERHDGWWYKAEYLRRLATPVEQRLQSLRSGAACPDDFLMAGSLEMLNALRAAGIAMYLASGTDHADVVREATALGVADYFSAIAGAQPDTLDCPKEQALRSLLQQAGVSGGALLVVGDGRVEIALGRDIGAVTLGIASDEAQRHGINPGKYTRLQQAGAQAISGDFTEWAFIMRWLGL